MIDGGANLIQLREKYASPRAFYDDALPAVVHARERGAMVLINDRVDIALAAGADGVHLGQTDILPADARKVLGERAVIGYSTHSINQVEAALAMQIDYLAIGPVFSTSTKENPDSVVGTDGVTAARNLVNTTPLVAIGGITLASAEAVIRSGADSVALISSLLIEADKISIKYNDLNQKLNNIVQRG